MDQIERKIWPAKANPSREWTRLRQAYGAAGCEWTRLRQAYGAAGCEWTRIRESNRR